jgi:hypothetical protein
VPKPKFDFSEDIKGVKETYRDELARLTTLTATDIERLFPRNIDMQRFEQLMKIVNASASRNRRTAALTKNMETFGGTVMRLLELLT